MTQRPTIPPFPAHLNKDELLAVTNLWQSRHAAWMLDDADAGTGSDGRSLPAPISLVVELHAREVVLGRWRDERIEALEKQFAELLAARSKAGKVKTRP
jgi:hypothetical protein